MATLTVSTAAKITGKNRSTIQRYIQSGKLSASKDANGVLIVDTAELSRVFGNIATDWNDQSDGEPDNQDNAALRETVDVLREQLKVAQERERRLLSMLESEQEARRQLEQRLLPAANEDAPRKGFFARLFGN